MGLRLNILTWWTPNYVIRKELQNISDKTTAALSSLTSKYTTKDYHTSNQHSQPSTNIEEQRRTMAQTQAEIVETLASAIGHDEAVRLGRQTLFQVGQNLGKQTRRKLGVGDGPNDLIKAAKILYRVLGIEFHIQWHNQSSATVIIDKCALAQQYSKLTCEVLSATDEGVINGLQPHLTMKFREYIPGGSKNCLADIYFNSKEVVD